MCPHKVDASVKFDLSAMNFIARHRRIAIEQCIDSLTHSCLCHDAFCRRSSCMRMKRVVIHTSICKRKIKGNCLICKQLIALCCYHAKNCKEARCWVPFCNTVKTKMRRQNLLHERMDAARDLLRASVPDPEESDAIDVNMAKPYSFEDPPSGSGEASSDATDSGDEASDENRNHPPPLAPQPPPTDDNSTDDHSTDSADSELEENEETAPKPVVEETAPEIEPAQNTE